MQPSCFCSRESRVQNGVFSIIISSCNEVVSDCFEKSVLIAIFIVVFERAVDCGKCCFSSVVFNDDASSLFMGSVAGLQYPSSRVQTRPKPSDFQGEKILSTPSFGGEVKLSVPCRRFASCRRSLNLRGSRNLGKIIGKFLAHSSTFRCQALSRRCGRTGTWRRKWERLKFGESNGTLPPRTCQDAVCQSHTGHMTGLWFLPARPLRLNTDE